MRVVSMIQLALAPEIKTQRVEGENIEGLMGKAWEYLCLKAANQSHMFEDGVVSTQNGDGKKSPWPHQQFQSLSKSIGECIW